MNKGERIAVISLLIIIAILLSFSVFRPALHFSEKDMVAFHNLDSLIALQEAALEQAALEKAEREQASTTLEHTSEKHFSKKKSTNRASLTGGTTNDTPPKTASTISPSKKIPILELNSTDSVALVDLPQIGEVMASRIQRYRDRLGGFVCYEQLYEVKGMDSARFSTVRPYLLLDTTDIKKLEINRDEFKTLLRHPYLDYNQVKAIVNHRERKGLIRNWEQLQGITGDINPLLEQYISY